MPTLTTTERGQLTFKKEVLRHMGVQPGEQIEYDLLPDGQVRLKAAKPRGSIDSFVGLLAGRSKKIATIDEIRNAAADSWSGKR